MMESLLRDFRLTLAVKLVDDAGNSVRAQKAIRMIVERLGANPYQVRPN